jgi:glycosyltransferase involved in cell wall biosynthesis
LKVSFIIPSLRQRPFLEDALDSIRRQELPDGSFEVLVFDGGSDDGTREFVQNHPLVSHWECEPDRGQGHAVNKGLLRARGEIIAWLNSDDLYLPGALTEVLRHLDDHPETDVVYGRALDIDETGQPVREYPSQPWSEEALLDSCFISQPAAFFRKSFAERNGFLREDLSLSLDYEYWLRARSWGRFSFLPTLLAANRVHPAAKSSAFFLKQLRESTWVVHQATGEWRRAWLRRLASAEGRARLKPFGLADSALRPWLSAILYRKYAVGVKIRRPPFPKL